jgi:general secretion pathway protein J
MRCDKNSPGFTLIELLVAISILAIVAVLGWRGLDSIVRSRVALTAELEQTRALQLTFAQLQSDCAHIVNPLNYPNLPEGRSSWIEPQRLILIRNVYAEDQAPAMQLVTYRQVNDSLTRFESITTRDLSVLSQLLQQARNPPEGQVEIVMQKNMASLTFEGYPTTSLGGTTYTGAQVGASAPASSPATPSNLAVPVTDQTKVTTGLQVTMQLVNREHAMQKIIMLGGI